jgi:hypothetical protein
LEILELQALAFTHPGIDNEVESRKNKARRHLQRMRVLVLEYSSKPISWANEARVCIAAAKHSVFEHNVYYGSATHRFVGRA